MRLFINHGGYNSILESTISGVPMLLLPLFFDQHRNARSMEWRQVGRILSPHLITEETMRRELDILLNDPRLVLLDVFTVKYLLLSVISKPPVVCLAFIVKNPISQMKLLLNGLTLLYRTARFMSFDHNRYI
jgi:hypothetical protein